MIAEFTGLNEKFKSVAGFEANGGFLLGSDVVVNNKLLKKSSTRDAVIEAIMLLSFAQKSSIGKLVADLR